MAVGPLSEASPSQFNTQASAVGPIVKAVRNQAAVIDQLSPVDLARGQGIALLGLSTLNIACIELNQEIKAHLEETKNEPSKVEALKRRAAKLKDDIAAAKARVALYNAKQSERGQTGQLVNPELMKTKKNLRLILCILVACLVVISVILILHHHDWNLAECKLPIGLVVAGGVGAIIWIRVKWTNPSTQETLADQVHETTKYELKNLQGSLDRLGQ